jgi:imidazole glycerol-phosphate synthase subunit HisH
VKVGIINYESGNLFSIQKIIKDLDYKVSIISQPSELKNFDKYILPGVGSFSKAMETIKKNKLIDEIQENIVQKKKMLLGICLGMQILFDEGTEDGNTKGLNFLNGKVKNLETLGCKLTLPHIGWNNIIIKKKHPIVKNISNNTDFYFANNYVATCSDSIVITISNYGVPIISSIAKDNIWGVQFHPEKSSRGGKQLISNFLKY